MSASTTAGLLVGLTVVLLSWPARLPGHLVRRVGRERPGRRWPWRAASATRVRDELALLEVAESLAAALGAGLDVASAHGVVVEAARGAGGGPGSPGSAPSHGRVRGRELGRRLVADALTPRSGETVAQAWARAGASSTVAAGVGHALEVSGRIGSPARAAVQRAVEAARGRLETEGEVAAAVAGARATGSLLTALPLAGPLAAVALGLDLASTYAYPPATAALLAGVGLTAVGHRWVRRQVRAAEQEERIA